MDYFEVFKFVLMIIETGALLGTLIFGTKGIKEKQDRNARRSLLTQAGIYSVIYIVLNMIRLYVFR